MARNTVGRWTDERPAADDYQSVPHGGQDTYEPGLYPDAAIDTRKVEKEPAAPPSSNRPDRISRDLRGWYASLRRKPGGRRTTGESLCNFA